MEMSRKILRKLNFLKMEGSEICSRLTFMDAFESLPRLSPHAQSLNGLHRPILSVEAVRLSLNLPPSMLSSCLKVSPASGCEQSQSRKFCHKEKKMKKKTHKENPFSDRGLDKFAEVSAELKAKRDKIIAEVGANQADNSITVRFTYSHSLRNWVPIVSKGDGKEEKKSTGKPKEEERHDKNQKKNTDNSGNQKPKTFASDVKLPGSPTKLDFEKKKKKEMEKSVEEPTGDEMGFKRASHPPRHQRKEAVWWPLLTPLIPLFCLFLFGKTLAILCTALWWYAVDCFQERAVAKGRESNCYVKKTKSQWINRLLVDEESCIRRILLK